MEVGTRTYDRHFMEYGFPIDSFDVAASARARARRTRVLPRTAKRGSLCQAQHTVDTLQT
jgi:hypothetical protein